MTAARRRKPAARAKALAKAAVRRRTARLRRRIWRWLLDATKELRQIGRQSTTGGISSAKAAGRGGSGRNFDEFKASRPDLFGEQPTTVSAPHRSTVPVGRATGQDYTDETPPDEDDAEDGDQA